MPSLPKLAGNFAKAMGRVMEAAVTGEQLRVGEIEYECRLLICRACKPFFVAAHRRCSHKDCGCFVEVKAWLATENCPIGAWTDPRQIKAYMKMPAATLPLAKIDAVAKAGAPVPTPPAPSPVSRPARGPETVLTIDDMLARRQVLADILGEGSVTAVLRALDADKGCSGCKMRRYYDQLSVSLVVDLRKHPEVRSRVRELFPKREYVLVSGRPTLWQDL